MPVDSYSLASLNHALDLVFARMERPAAASKPEMPDFGRDPEPWAIPQLVDFDYYVVCADRPPAADSGISRDRYLDPDFDDVLGFEPIGETMARVVREIAP